MVGSGYYRSYVGYVTATTYLAPLYLPVALPLTQWRTGSDWFGCTVGWCTFCGYVWFVQRYLYSRPLIAVGGPATGFVAGYPMPDLQPSFTPSPLYLPSCRLLIIPCSLTLPLLPLYYGAFLPFTTPFPSTAPLAATLALYRTIPPPCPAHAARLC